MHDVRHKARLVTWALTLLIGLSLAGSASAQFGNQIGVILGESGQGPDNLTTWDIIDAEIDLTGLWGSIDTDMDLDPVWAAAPNGGPTYLVWSKWNGIRHKLVFARRVAGGSWSGVMLVETTPSSTYNDVTPSIVVDNSGKLHVFWLRMVPAGGVIMHSARIGIAWTVPFVISDTEPAHSPLAYVDEGAVRVEYLTATARITVEIVIYESSGGSDDVDPGTGVAVESNQIGNEILPE